MREEKRTRTTLQKRRFLHLSQPNTEFQVCGLITVSLGINHCTHTSLSSCLLHVYSTLLLHYCVLRCRVRPTFNGTQDGIVTLLYLFGMLATASTHVLPEVC